MKYTTPLINLSLIIFPCILASAAHAANTLNYLTDFKVPMQKTYCIGKASNGDMNIFKECMLAIEKDVYKCDKDAKILYDKKFSDYDKKVTDFMSDIKPIAEKYFTCLQTIY